MIKNLLYLKLKFFHGIKKKTPTIFFPYKTLVATFDRLPATISNHMPTISPNFQWLAILYALNNNAYVWQPLDLVKWDHN